MGATGTRLASPEVEDEILRVRRFNRFYTQRIGVVSLLGEGLSLAASRVLFEIERLGSPAAVEIGRELDLDSGYLSRLVQGLERKGLISKERSSDDGRRRQLRLTAVGKAVYADLTARADRAVGEMLAPLSRGEQRNLVAALDTVEGLLGGGPEDRTVRIHDHDPGDLGWVVHRHGVLYAEEPGFNEVFEAMVVEIVASFAQAHDPRRERLWIAEIGGEKAGSVMLARETDAVARLRLFLVEPRARGRGVGSRLLETLLRFARRRGYKRIVLSTVHELPAARRLYQGAGFQLAESGPSHSKWGVAVTEEAWELDLDP